jgi:hypothetical protein
MITRHEAETIAAAHVASYMEHCIDLRFGLAINLDATSEYDFGWVFFYNSTSPERYPIAGNAPFIVERTSGAIVETGTANSLEYYIENYRQTGDPHGQLGCRIQLLGYNYGANKIAATKAIREHTPFQLKESKDCVEACMEGKVVVLTAKSYADAASLLAALRSSLFAAERLSETGRTKG